MSTRAKLVAGSRQASPAVPRRQKIEVRRAKSKKIRWPLFLFLLALVVPWVIYIGPLRMSLYRIVLSVMVLPCLGMWMFGKEGRKRTADISLMLYWFWCTLSTIKINGLSVSVQPSGITFVETVGAYMLARCYIRDAEDFYNAVQLLFRVVAFLLPFAILEVVIGQNILRELFEVIFPTQSDVPMMRSGLTRARSVFDHPILFGVYTGSITALVYLVLGYQKSFLERAVRTGIVAATSLMSLSAGALVAVVTQVFLLSWGQLLAAVKIRWQILIGLFILIYLTIELGTNRSALDLLTSFFIFDPSSYWYRRLIWQYASASALNHPLFGVEMHEWERPTGMPASIDNFWLVQAVSHGMPAAFLLLLTFVSVFLAASFKQGLDDKLLQYRTGFLISMTAFFLAGWTVAFWDHAYVLFMFLMGSGVWILDVKTEGRTPGR
jgi:hypothetical protein